MAYRYKTIKIDGKTKLAHRHVMELHLGRALLPTEQVHHRNGDRYDNRIENLEVLSAKDHQKGHKQKHPESKPCQNCGATFMPHPTKRARAKTCSPRCRSELTSKTERATKAAKKKPPIAAALVRANFAHEFARSTRRAAA